MKHLSEPSEFTRERTAPLKEDVKQTIQNALTELQEYMQDFNSAPNGNELNADINRKFTEDDRQKLYDAVRKGLTAKLALPAELVEKLERADELVDILKTILGKIDDSPEELVSEDPADDPTEV